MKRLLAAWMLLVQLALCWTIGLAEDAFEKETYYIHNDEMNRSIYAVQIKPKDLAEGEKVPLIIYVHGGNGTANSYIGLAKTLSEQKIAGLMFECCGGNNGKHPPPKVTEQISFLRTIPRASATWKLCLLLQKRWISLIRTAFICGGKAMAELSWNSVRSIIRTM